MHYPQTNMQARAAPFYCGLTPEQCRLIHCASLEILEHTGVFIYHQPAINLLKKAGCLVQDNRIRCVYCPDIQRGVTGPITFAGAMACANAGQLVGSVIAQLVRGGQAI